MPAAVSTFTVTLDQPYLARRLTVVRQLRKLPLVLSAQEVALLLEAAPGPQLTGDYGGLWRRQGRSPQQLVGTGFIAQGFDLCSAYRRTPESAGPRVAFAFEGIGMDETIGDFGLIGGGAAGLEVDIVFQRWARRRTRS
jgi:hypothetical protein